MPDIPVRLPLGGLSENLAFQDQEPATTRDAQNVRSQDNTTGRIRLTQRSGLEKYNATELSGTNKVADLASVTYDSRNTTYAQVGATDANVTWSTATPSQADCPALAVDRQGNVYAVDGNSGIVKYSSDGEKVWQLTLPTKDQSDVVRAIFVDDLDCVYAAVSDGSRQDLARIWKYRQLPDNEYEQVFEIAPKAFTTKIKVVVDKLYTSQVEPDTKTAFIRVYDALEATEPQLAQLILVPYPCNGFDVKDDGSVVVACASDGDDGGNAALTFQRGPNPKFPKSTPVLLDWTPYDLDDFDQRVWAWYAPEDIGEFDVFGDLEDGAEVRRWPDRSNGGRHLYADATTKGPAYVERGRAIWPSVSFASADSTHLETLVNSSSTKAFADQQKTMLPSYVDSMWCAFIVCRAVNEATLHGLLEQVLVTGVTYEVTINQNSAAATTAGEVRFIASTDVTDAGAGTSGEVLEGTYTNDNDLMLLTIQYDGGIETGNPGTGFTRSMFKVNGEPIDRYEGDASSGVAKTVIGEDATSQFTGDILEMVVLDRRDRDDNAESSYASGDPTASGGGKVLQHDPVGSDPDPGDDQATGDLGDNEMTRIEGYLAHKYGFSHLLPNSGDTYPHPFGAVGATINLAAGPPPDGSTGDHAILGTRFALVAKFNARGELVWAINGTTVADQDGAGGGGFTGGLGLDVAVNSDGNIYSIGPVFANGTPVEDVQIIMLLDEGETVSAANGDGAWGADIGANIGATGFQYPRLAVDQHDNVIVPINTGSTTASIQAYKKDGTLLWNYNTPSTTLEGMSVAVDPKIPDYDGDLTNEIAQFVYLSTENGGTLTNSTVWKLEVVEATATSGTPRTVVTSGVANSNIVTFTTAAVATPTGGSAAIDSNAQYVQSVTHFGKVYYADGLSPIDVFDPRDDTVTDLVAKGTGGEAPRGVKIIEAWRGRLVVARGVGLIDEAFNWKMSKISDPEDWNVFPAVTTSDQAIAGSNAIGPGMVPDIVNGFVPYNDDLAYFLCDHSIYQLTGDPMDGGQFDLVSDITGGAFGRAWCKDPQGNLYFFGSRGGLYVMRPGAIPERITLNTVERRLQNVDLSTHYVRLAWNYRDEGVHILQFPFGTPPATQVKHWFFDAKVGAMWEDTFGKTTDTDVQPTAILVLDGDQEADRIVLLGSEDGFVRKWTESAKDDDGEAINAHVLIGPLAGPDPLVETRFMGPHVVLADELDSARYELFATNDPGTVGLAAKTGDLSPGINPNIRNRVRGLYSYLRLRNSSANQTFAVETVTMHGTSAGRKRSRVAP